MRYFKIAICIFALFVSLSFNPMLIAQTAGSISGHLIDPAGANLAQADVTLTNVSMNSVRATKSTDAGDYTFVEVPPGIYNLQVKHLGFKTTKTDSFEVQIEQSVRFDFTLEIGTVTESIEVTATGTLLQSDNAGLGTVVENAAVNELPLNGRNYLSLVGLRRTSTRFRRPQARRAAGWAAIVHPNRSRSAASESCSTTTRWMA